jgi:DUF1707 SHOCT-like domain
VSDRPAPRASDAEREATVEQLRLASADGRLTLEELSERVAAAYESRTHDELGALTRDLPVQAASATAIPSRRRTTRLVFALFGSTEREGRLRLRRRVTCVSMFGNVDLDLRDATLEGDVIDVYALGAFAALDIYVPEGVEVDFRGFSIFGHARARGDDPPPRSGTPLVRVHALSLWAGLDVWRVPVAWAGRTLSQVIKGIEKGERKQLGA